MFPLMAFFTSAGAGSGFASSRPLALMTMPGMQKPHWTAPALAKVQLYTSFSRGDSPSTVTTLRPASLAVVNRQARAALPSTSTMQAPQAPSEQPSFTEVRRRSSRR